MWRKKSYKTDTCSKCGDIVDPKDGTCSVLSYPGKNAVDALTREKLYWLCVPCWHQWFLDHDSEMCTGLGCLSWLAAWATENPIRRLTCPHVGQRSGARPPLCTPPPPRAPPPGLVLATVAPPTPQPDVTDMITRLTNRIVELEAELLPLKTRIDQLEGARLPQRMEDLGAAMQEQLAGLEERIATLHQRVPEQESQPFIDNMVLVDAASSTFDSSSAASGFDG